MTLPETLTVLDVEDLMTSLGRPSDRTAIARALAQTEIEGVVAPGRRGEPWRIPTGSWWMWWPRSSDAETRGRLLLRGCRSNLCRAIACPLLAFWPAARILLGSFRNGSGARLRPMTRKQREAADAAARLRQAAAERERQREARVNAAELARLQDLARLHLYFDARVAATAARFPKLDRDTLNSPEFADFMLEWPYPADRPSWWQPPPGALNAAVELIRPWVTGKTRECPRLEHLLPREINYSQPWPWRREPTDVG